MGDGVGPQPMRRGDELKGPWTWAVGTLRTSRAYDPLLRAMDAGLRRSRMHWYSAFVQPGDLCFDIGANLGNRVDCFLRLGASVVAVEPQERCVQVMHRRFGALPCTVLRAAVGAQPGNGVVHVSSAHKISSMSREFQDAMARSGRFRGAGWTGAEEVPVVTLDMLLRAYGTPRFCKIDVEGYEGEVLAGLSHPIPALSFEATPELAGVAEACVQRLSQLGDYGFNLAIGESLRWEFEDWCDGRSVLARVDDLGSGVGWADIYGAVRGNEPRPRGSRASGPDRTRAASRRRSGTMERRARVDASGSWRRPWAGS